MYFSSMSELLRMDGHGPYVWSAYFIVAVVLCALVSDPLLRRRRLLERVRQRVITRDGAG